MIYSNVNCKKCGSDKVVRNGSRREKPCFLCRACSHQFTNESYKENHFDRYIAKIIYEKSTKPNKPNAFTKSVWSINQIARLLGLSHSSISNFLKSELPPINKSEFVKYLEIRSNGTDILNVLGLGTDAAPSESLNKIINRKQRITKPMDERKVIKFHISESEYLGLVNMPISNRKEAIFVLGALLGCRSSEILGVKFSDIDRAENTIFFRRTITFENEGITESTENWFVTNRKYPLTKRMLDVIEWIESDNKATPANDFLCRQPNGIFLTSWKLNKLTLDIREKADIKTQFKAVWASKHGVSDEKIKRFAFRWLRYSVKMMMLKSGVSKSDVKAIFGNKNTFKNNTGYTQDKNQLEIMRQAYDALEKYIDEKSVTRSVL